jgi:class 3 adenylate cyclase
LRGEGGQPWIAASSFVDASAYRVDAIVGPFSMSGSNASDLNGKSPDRRKLIAVVYADMVGYSRLIGLDDEETLGRLRTLRANLIDPAIEEHGGRIVQTGGDSLLIVFDSIDGAVRCAVKVQQQVPVVDRDQPQIDPFAFVSASTSVTRLPMAPTYTGTR